MKEWVKKLKNEANVFKKEVYLDEDKLYSPTNILNLIAEIERMEKEITALCETIEIISIGKK